MIPFKILGGTWSGQLGQLDSPDNWLDITLRFLVTVKGQEHEVPVRAKLVIGSHLLDRDVEVYAPDWPDGSNIQANELQQAVRGYLFAFLNTEGALADAKRDAEKTSSLSTFGLVWSLPRSWGPFLFAHPFCSHFLCSPQSRPRSWTPELSHPGRPETLLGDTFPRRQLPALYTFSQHN
jgi:hypothetical protein